MPEQIQKGYNFQVNQLVTDDDLNQLVADATLKRGAVTEQPSVSGAVEAADLIIVDDVSDTDVLSPKKTTIGNVLTSNLPIVSSQVSSSGSVLEIVNADGQFVTATGYSHISGGDVSVASPSHVVQVGDFVDVVCQSTSGESGSLFSGRFLVTEVALNSFVYKTGDAGASSGSCTYRKSGTSKFNSNVNVSDEMSVGGRLNINGDAMKMPVGPTTSRPANPLLGDFRYNTSTKAAEIYDGTNWKDLGNSPFELTGGDMILEPDPISFAGYDCTVGVISTITAVSGPSNFSLRRITVNPANFVIDYIVGQEVEVSDGFTSPRGVVYDFNTAANTVDVLFYSDAPNFTSGKVKKAGNYRVHIFRNSGSFTVGPADGYAHILAVGGGGGATWAKPATYPFLGQTAYIGGGGGGVAEHFSVFLKKNTVYEVTVGLGGVSSINNSTDGQQSRVKESGSTFVARIWANGGSKEGQAGGDSVRGSDGFFAQSPTYGGVIPGSRVSGYSNYYENIFPGFCPGATSNGSGYINDFGANLNPSILPIQIQAYVSSIMNLPYEFGLNAPLLTDGYADISYDQRLSGGKPSPDFYNNLMGHYVHVGYNDYGGYYLKTDQTLFKPRRAYAEEQSRSIGYAPGKGAHPFPYSYGTETVTVNGQSTVVSREPWSLSPRNGSKGIVIVRYSKKAPA